MCICVMVESRNFVAVKLVVVAAISLVLWPEADRADTVRMSRLASDCRLSAVDFAHIINVCDSHLE